MHHSLLKERKIRVELTAGGGGNSASRKQKIEDKRAKLQKERERNFQRVAETKVQAPVKL